MVRVTLPSAISLLIGVSCGGAYLPYIERPQFGPRCVEHKPPLPKVSDDQMFPLSSSAAWMQKKANFSMIVNGFCREVFKELANGGLRGSGQVAGSQVWEVSRGFNPSPRLNIPLINSYRQ